MYETQTLTRIVDYRNPIKVPCFKYAWGREDCPTAPDLKDINEFPAPSMNSAQMFDYFKREFDFGKDEVSSLVLIMNNNFTFTCDSKINMTSS